MTTNFIVYTVIATYNGDHWIRKCLDSLANSSVPTQVVVIDNNSTDNTIEIIELEYPGIQLIKTGANLGFGRANNIGMKIAIKNNADYTFLLNQDAWIEKETIAQLISAHSEDKKLGIISPVHLTGNGEDFDPIFYQYLSASDIHNLVKSSLFNDIKRNKVIATNFVNAAAWLISKDCLLATGGFDPIFYHYGEDNNYAHRVLYHGFTIGVVCDAKVYHDKHYSEAEKNVGTHPDFKHDRIIYMHQACDIRNKSFNSMFIKRLLRYYASGFIGIATMKPNAITYNFQMANNILKTFSKVKSSRKDTVARRPTYLNDQAS